MFSLTGVLFVSLVLIVFFVGGGWFRGVFLENQRGLRLLPRLWCFCSLNGHIIRSSSGFQSFFGTKRWGGVIWKLISPHIPAFSFVKFRDAIEAQREACVALFEKDGIKRQLNAWPSEFLGGGFFLALSDVIIPSGETTEAEGTVEEGEKMLPVDQLPFIVWYMDAKGRRLLKNTAYQSLEKAVCLQGGERKFLFPLSDEMQLLQGVMCSKTPVTQQLSYNVGGQKTSFEITGVADRDVGAWFFGADMSSITREVEQLCKQVLHFEKSFADLGTAVLIFAPNQTLEYFNQSVVRLFGLDKRWLLSGPSFDDIFEALRHKRFLPEVIDFSAYKKQFTQFFDAPFSSPHDEMIYLSGDKHLRAMANNFPGNRCFVAFEDVTEILRLKRQKKEQLHPLQTFMAHAEEGVLALGGDQHITALNPAFAQLWNFKVSELSEGSTLQDAFTFCFQQITQKAEEMRYRSFITTCMAERVMRTFLVTLPKGTILRVTYIPLESGGHMLRCSDYTNIFKVATQAQEASISLRVERYVLYRKLQALKDGVQEQLPTISRLESGSSTYLSSTVSHILKEGAHTISSGYVLEGLRRFQLSLKDQGAFLRETLSLERLLEEWVAFFSPLADEQGVQIDLLNDTKIPYLFANRNSVEKLVQHMLGYTICIARPKTRLIVTIEKTRDGLLAFNVSAAVQVPKALASKGESDTLFYPWNSTLNFLKDFALLAGGRLQFSSRHQKRIRVACVFLARQGTPLKSQDKGMLTALRKGRDSACG
jgi:PAS domain-containing protein